MSIKNKLKFGELLLKHNYISESQLEDALEKQKYSHKRLGEILIESGYIRRKDVVDALGKQLGYERVNFKKYRLSSKLADYIPENLAKNYNIAPLKLKNNRLVIAMQDPLDLEPIDLLNSINSYDLEILIAAEEEIKHAQQLIYSDYKAEQSFDNVPKMVRSIIQKAVHKKATDIHIEPEEDNIRIRYRISGILHQEASLKKDNFSNLVSHLKTLAKLDITTTREPQSGSFYLDIDDQDINARISTMPTLYGEKVVIRLLIKDRSLLDINNLGFSDYNLEKLKNLIEKPYGLILVTGPTSSGKTTTLAAILNYINSSTKNIITIEDPVEYQLKSVYQVQIDKNNNLDFPKALRSALRQDPDVIMIGEIRDKETAEIAIRAAITGHLVLSTLHTQDAFGVIGRLISLGVPPYLIHSTLIGVVAQRLVRFLCNCSERKELNTEEKKFLNIAPDEEGDFFQYVGCEECANTGFNSQTTIEEVLELDEDYEDLIINESNTKKIKRLAERKGFKSLKDNSRDKVLQNITTFSEVKRVLL
jgi:type IV pilus assembly protein PilB